MFEIGKDVYVSITSECSVLGSIVEVYEENSVTLHDVSTTITNGTDQSQVTIKGCIAEVLTLA